MDPVYLDNNATTQPDPDVLEHVREVSLTCFGNPGSQHSFGRTARRVLEDSREQIAALLNAPPDGVIFTSGATEANNLAIYGLARGRGTIACTAGEHPASEEAIRDLITRGWSRRTLNVDSKGRLRDPSIDESVRLATVIHAHNETGVIQDVSAIRVQAERVRVPWHLDATQSVGKTKVNFASLGCTCMSFASHKFHGPRGIGCLVTQSGVSIAPRNLGGYQESGRRGGTEPVALAAGMAMALELATTDMSERSARMQKTRDQLEAGLRQLVPDIVIHGRAADRLPNTCCAGFPGRDGHALLVALDIAGVCVSLGSACASGSPEPAPVLLAMGVSPELALSSLRFSTSHMTTPADIDVALARIANVIGFTQTR